MNPKTSKPALPAHSAEQNIAYIRQMLGQLRTVAQNEGADMLRYFIEMAYLEAGDIQSGARPLSLGGDRDPATGMPVKPAGEIEL